MKKKIILFLVSSLFVFFMVSACQATAAPAADPAKAKIYAAATAQAKLNLLQTEASELEKTLDEKLADKYTGMLVKSDDQLQVKVYLASGSVEDLKPFVEDPELLKVISVVPAEVTRKEMRNFRESIISKMAKLGAEVTTSIMMDPPRLEVYTLDKAGTEKKIQDNQIALPGYVHLIQQDVLSRGG
ncbi:MAG: hypothetical protein VB108_08890 [Anaerolineaceae bacterium]|nr:hypothetical protein [Anaerolineaceae bacterium]